MQLSDSVNTGHANHMEIDRRSDEKREKRDYTFKNKDGDRVGNNFVVPKGDFSRFLGYAPATAAEKNGQANVTGYRVLELALQDEMKVLGEGAAARAADYVNLYASTDPYEQRPGSERALIQAGLDGVNSIFDRDVQFNPSQMGQIGQMGNANYMEMMTQLTERTREANTRHLEMQYKFDQIHRSQTTVSTLMKARHDSIVRAIRESH
jgi:hypothetical protein